MRLKITLICIRFRRANANVLFGTRMPARSGPRCPNADQFLKDRYEQEELGGCTDGHRRRHGRTERGRCAGAVAPRDRNLRTTDESAVPRARLDERDAHRHRRDGDSVRRQQRRREADPDGRGNARRRPVRLGRRRRAAEQFRRTVGQLRGARLRRRRQHVGHRLPRERVLVEPRDERAARHREHRADGSAQGAGVRAVRPRRPRRPDQLYDEAAAVRAREHDRRVGRQLRRAARDARFDRPRHEIARLPLRRDETKDNGSFRDTVSSKRYLFAPSFTWDIDADTTLHYEFETVRQRAPLDRGVLAVNGQLGAIPASRFLGEPRDGDYDVRNSGHQFTLEHRFNADWSINAGFAQRDTDLSGRSSEAFALQPDGRTLWRRYRQVAFHSNDVQGRVEVAGNARTAGIAHTFVMGVDAYRFNYDQFVARSTPTAAAPYAIDIFDPVYGQPAPAVRTATNLLERDDGQGLYAQGHARVSGRTGRVLAGLRWDRFHQSVENRLKGVTTSQLQTALSPRIGIVYEASAALSLYANTAYSFRPNNGADANGHAFDPEKGHGYEAGVKWAGTRWLATVAAFYVNKRNVLTADPANPGFSRAAGEVRSRGVEFEWNGELGHGLRGIVNFAYVDAQVTRDTVLTPGARLVDIPRLSGSALLMYETALPLVDKAGAGAGVIYVGRRAGNTANTQDGFDLPAYATVQLNGYVQVNKR
ncbi:Outer membrane receptor protein [Burkholderia dolosa AU0158]|nr:Outer membrane receptor protein [Burkholderia dolosa AU0158]